MFNSTKYKICLAAFECVEEDLIWLSFSFSGKTTDKCQLAV
jgi:hypothetical protein